MIRFSPEMLRPKKEGIVMTFQIGQRAGRMPTLSGVCGLTTPNSVSNAVFAMGTWR